MAVVLPPRTYPRAMPRVGVYPGTFNPLTVAHLAIAEAAVAQCSLDRVDLALSEVPLGREVPAIARLVDRVAVLRHAASSRPWLGVVVTRAQLVADIGAGYDVVVMGADKWAQLGDEAFYESTEHRDAALARLPAVALAPRPPHPVPEGVRRLELPSHLQGVSATRARGGVRSMMAAEAAAFDARTGAWSDPARYLAWVGGEGDGASPRSS